MSCGVIINLSKDNALITVAMLQTFRKNGSDYLDLLMPFLNKILSTLNGEIDQRIIQGELKKFGFEDISLNIINELLNRSAKRKVIVRNNNRYYIENKVTSCEYDKRRKDIVEIVDRLLSNLGKYLTETRHVNYSVEDLGKILINFLTEYGLIIAQDELYKLREIKSKTSKDNYWIGQFIINEFPKKDSVYFDLLEIIKGFLSYNALYYFSTKEAIDYKAKLNNTIVVLDVRQILNILKFNTDIAYEALNELLCLIRNNGGKINVFEHTVNEAIGILNRFKLDKSNRNKMTLYNLQANNYTDIQIDGLIKRIHNSIKKLGIEIVDLNNIIDQKTDYLKYEFNKDIFQGYLQEKYINAKEQTIENDANSVYGVHLIRGHERKGNIENCKAILLTHSQFLVKVTREYLKDRLEKNREINLVICDNSLTSLLWLKKPSNNKIPEMTLLKAAYSSTAINELDYDVFLDNLNKLEIEGTIDSTDAFEMRLSYHTKDIIAEVTQGDEISDMTVIKVNQLYKERKTADDNDKIEESSIVLDLKKENEELKSYKEKKEREIEKKYIKNNEIAKEYSNVLAWIIIIAAGILPTITFILNVKQVYQFIGVIAPIAFITYVIIYFLEVIKMFREKSNIKKWFYSKIKSHLDDKINTI